MRSEFARAFSGYVLQVCFGLDGFHCDRSERVQCPRHTVRAAGQRWSEKHASTSSRNVRKSCVPLRVGRHFDRVGWRSQVPEFCFTCELEDFTPLASFGMRERVAICFVFYKRACEPRYVMKLDDAWFYIGHERSSCVFGCVRPRRGNESFPSPCSRTPLYSPTGHDEGAAQCYSSQPVS